MDGTLDRVIKAVVLDLDNCLAAADEVGRELYESMFAAIRDANDGTVPEASLERALADAWRMPLDAVAWKYGFSAEMLAAGWEVGRQLTIAAPMQGYPDLPLLAELRVMQFVVTSGFRRLQESKVDALDLRGTVAGVYVDAIDEPGRKGKEKIFQEILERHRLHPGSVLVVGDTPESEIEAGNRLGIPTVQILRPGVTRGTNATYYVRDLAGLRDLLHGPRE